MIDCGIVPLSPTPVDWTDVEMWGFVNAVDTARQSGTLPDGQAVVAVRGEGGARPVALEFSRPGKVAEFGWSWANHNYDEQAEVLFQQDAVLVRLSTSASKIIVSRCIVILAIMRLFSHKHDVHGKGVICSLGDSDGDEPILSFSSKAHGDFLLPDPYFMLTRSYERERGLLAEDWQPIEERDARMYWRGAPSGLAKYANQLDSQRVKLVMMANTPANRLNFNVRLASRSGLDEDVTNALEACDGFSAPEDQMEISRYAFNIDVDGVSSSWTGFFLKLLAGGTVVKIASDAGYRQWYYTALKPWVHYVEVAPDLADFSSIGRMLTLRRDWAAEVAEAGRAFALSLDLASQLSGAISAVQRAVVRQN
ncbi:hypothetical protein GGQ88_000651 [Novosphingobium hassiacum]|uniref:Glycosyl transferase CAP10 domain-containing protein n=1 Tax=Novosphingobium hassiacum TaxID=173676 RepID=A0A7W6EUR6_9SPHN|nr:glycosyl transferase family 90 [Novosphingobium hassiacum]MBB3859411.1 hypothetical protein [Novosphingobium hassiacum]